jgi:SAM-dependent methyltransferase
MALQSIDDPFPYPPAHFTYEQLKALASDWDQQVGFRVDEVERLLEDEDFAGEEVWLGFDPQTVNTPYSEVRSILEDLKLKPGQTLVDLGAGYGRYGLVAHFYWPGVRFVGFEIAAPRAEEGNRVLSLVGAQESRIFVQNLADPSFVLPEADAYIIYDYSHARSVEKSLQDLKRISKPFQLVARGGRVRSRLEKFHPWLTEIVRPLHRGRYSIFYSHETAKPLAP